MIPGSLFEELHYLSIQGKAVQSHAYQDEFLFPEDTDEVRAAGNLGDKPLIVLTRGQNLTPEWNSLQVEQTHLSTRGWQIVVSDSGDMIPFEHPNAVVNAVQEVYSAANSR